MQKPEKQVTLYACPKTVKEGCAVAQYTNHFDADFDRLLRYIEESVLKGSISATKEGGSDFSCGDARCATRVYERYSWIGNNRLSLCVTLFGRNGDIWVSAITSGGSQALFFKINTWGEEAFLDKFIQQIENYRE